ncbi:unnamed protein product [Schistosoma margrebowiei]|uniref:Uncharacterized protein n=1 Tax=Schistosoma margrebowiei TaxID=48269 RepID=A0A183LL78_9TREM|nr:unnamed protein product [Schistosoma margrebowiei]
MENVRTRRVADIASDHHLVVSKMKLKLKERWTTGQTEVQRFNTSFLRNTNKLNEFKITLSNRFQALYDLIKEGTTMWDNWKGIKEPLTLTYEEVLGHKKHHYNEWISMETLDKIQGGKNKKIAISSGRMGTEQVKAHTECTEANKRVMRSIRADKQNYLEELVTTAEKALRERNIRQLYNTTKKLVRKYDKPERPT